MQLAKTRHTVLILVFLLVGTLLPAQKIKDKYGLIGRDSITPVVVVKLDDSSMSRGRLLELNELTITIKLNIGGRAVTYPRSLVKSIRVVNPKRNPRDSTGAVIDTRADSYLLTTSAIPVKKGKVIYHNQMVLLNSIRFGISDNVSVGMGTEFLTWLNLENPHIISVNVKTGFPIANKLHVGCGVTGYFPVIVSSNSNNQPSNLLAPFAVVTYGSEGNNISLKSDVLWSENGFQFAYGLAGRVRLLPKFYYSMEVIASPSLSHEWPFGFADAGFQIGGQKSSVFLGAFIGILDGNATLLPGIGYTASF